MSCAWVACRALHTEHTHHLTCHHQHGRRTQTTWPPWVHGCLVAGHGRRPRNACTCICIGVCFWPSISFFGFACRCMRCCVAKQICCASEPFVRTAWVPSFLMCACALMCTCVALPRFAALVRLQALRDLGVAAAGGWCQPPSRPAPHTTHNTRQCNSANIRTGLQGAETPAAGTSRARTASTAARAHPPSLALPLPACPASQACMRAAVPRASRNAAHRAAAPRRTRCAHLPSRLGLLGCVARPLPAALVRVRACLVGCRGGPLRCCRCGLPCGPAPGRGGWVGVHGCAALLLPVARACAPARACARARARERLGGGGRARRLHAPLTPGPAHSLCLP